jgi:hypothetical protein
MFRSVASSEFSLLEAIHTFSGGPYWPLIQWLPRGFFAGKRRPEHEADKSPPSIVSISSEWSPLHVFTVVIKQIFYLPLNLSRSTPRCFQWILCFRFSNQNVLRISHLPNKYHMLMLPFAAHLKCYGLTAQIVSGWSIQTVKLLCITHFSHCLCHVLRVSAKFCS